MNAAVTSPSVTVGTRTGTRSWERPGREEPAALTDFQHPHATAVLKRSDKPADGRVSGGSDFSIVPPH
ncbi:Hypothetical protein NTJ_06428 [Nesidiocoris tenuis]|uniref:Uncharacterized protein n=1 Tax=Nesidiocoris tenuis TaxID=355587 RepID=A0ABN7AQA5_9HEMI|nr:Hypothetical protein NTJ_06428 [Nesidiocoris tenuis]